MRKLKLLFFSIILSKAVLSQAIPLGANVQNELNVLLQKSDSSIFTGYRAMDWLELQNIPGLRKQGIADSIFGISNNSNSKFVNHLFNDNWVQLKGRNINITLDPYLDATVGKSNEKSSVLFDGTIGMRLQGVLSNKLSFGFGLFTSQTAFPEYVDAFITSKSNVIPGQNVGTLNNSGRYTYSHMDAHVTYVPDKHILISAGYGKQFLGDGYRSLFLSDNSFNYPYVRLQARFWKITYNVIYSKYLNTSRIDDAYQGKYSVTHYLGMNFGKKLQIGLFENILWMARDSGSQRGFDVQYLNPIIFMRPIEFSVGSPDNAMMGITWKYKAFTKGHLYGQLGIDDLNIKATLSHHEQHLNNKYFIQLGMWNNEVFNVKGLTHRLEWNIVRPYTYGHRKPEQNYTHFNQALADPFNANFHEFISIFNYTKNRWYSSLENLLTIRGENPGLPYNNGEDLFGGEAGVPEFGSKTLQGIKNKYFYNQLSVGYLLNPKNRLSLQADFVYRNHSSPTIHQGELYFSFGIKTNLYNYYHDF